MLLRSPGWEEEKWTLVPSQVPVALMQWATQPLKTGEQERNRLPARLGPLGPQASPV